MKSGMKPVCRCSLCERHRHIRRIVKSGTVEQMRSLINELEETLALTEEDLEHKKAILDGSWPSAREYAERIMKITEPKPADAPTEANL